MERMLTCGNIHSRSRNQPHFLQTLLSCEIFNAQGSVPAPFVEKVMEGFPGFIGLAVGLSVFSMSPFTILPIV